MSDYFDFETLALFLVFVIMKSKLHLASRYQFLIGVNLYL